MVHAVCTIGVLDLALSDDDDDGGGDDSK